MLIGLLLDEGDQGVARAVAGIGCAVLACLVVAMVVPVVVLVNLFHAAPDSPGQAIVQAPSATSARSTQPIATGGGTASGVVELAQRYLGVPYVFGGTNPAVGLDCSGLVQLVFRQAGVALPRTAQQQYDATSHVSREDLQPGDLVFFARTYPDPNDWITHVGIYVGNGQQINAPTEGQVVSIQPVFSGFWGSHFVTGGRVRAL
jgi:cell wall-associated NlpC family hydrolase